MHYKLRKVNTYSYEIDGVIFKFIRDQRGDTYAQTSTETKPLYQFLDGFKEIVIRTRHTSPDIFRRWTRCFLHH